MARTICDIPLNRVEGDLEIRVEVEDGVVVDAWSAGTMFRGFERLLVGRGALDGLVVTPRVCGICSTTHLTAAAKALDAVAGVTPPDNGLRLRNLALMTEHIQSDVRQTVLMYMVDFANPAYRALPLFDEAVSRFAPFTGSDAVDTLRETKRVIELIAVIGGQWPHSSFMVPGGVTYAPPLPGLMQCRHILAHYRAWYERRVLGCSLDRWAEVTSPAGLDLWLDEAPAHRDGIVGFLLRFGRAVGLDRIGGGHGCYLSYGGLDMPVETGVRRPGPTLIPAGLVAGGARRDFDQALVAEHIAASWYTGYEGGRHPFDGVTQPYACGSEGAKYSWSKAPRYDGRPAETGQLAEALVAGSPLFSALVADGANALARQLARIVRPALLLPVMEAWLDEVVATAGAESYRAPAPIVDGDGVGLTQAARGALGHWVRIRGGRIAHYQIVTPTAWNGSPRDSVGVRGPWEEALIGVPLRDPANPIEAGHVVRSFDPCLVCTVHALRKGRTLGRVRLGA